MQGLEISREFYFEYGRPMLEREFAAMLDRIAVGLAGEGSECLGFDDGISRDHDFDAGFCLWLTAEDERRFGFRLERAYAALPKEFMGLRRCALSPVGGKRRGVISIESFYTRFLGTPDVPDSLEHWLCIPGYALAAASNGQVFTDPLGAFSAVREKLLAGYPEDVRKKKLASNLVLMAQSGQYNYPRCLARNEQGAAQLAVFEFVRNAISAIYLLNKRYEPFYKWAYRGLKPLPILGHIGDALQTLTETDNSPSSAKAKQEIIGDIAALFADELKRQSLTGVTGDELEKHAWSVLDGVEDAVLRNRHIIE